MVHKLQTNPIFQLDPVDNSRVVFWWRNIHDFTDYNKRIEFNHDIFYCYSDDYLKVHDGPKDRKTPTMTRDQRFCVSRNYTGEIFRYNAQGEFVGATDMAEFKRLGAYQHLVGCYGAPHGWDEFRSLNIMMRDMTAGFYWDYVKYDYIDPVYVPQSSIVQLGEELYGKLINGLYTRQNPDSRFKQAVKKRMELKRQKKLEEVD